MLVLTRKVGHKIHIGSGITVTVVLVQGNRVRLGVEAPADVPIVRAEVNDFLGREPIPLPETTTAPSA
jgi:carbon storage regulator